MDIAAIIALVSKGVTLVQGLIEAGQDAAPAIKALVDTFGGNKTEVTQAELDRCEAVLDALIDEFNVPLPE